MINTDQLRPDSNESLVCISSINETNTGVWYYPNGDQVPIAAHNGGTGPFISVRGAGSIVLRMNDDPVDLTEGLYKCVISDENGINISLVVGIYNTSTYESNGKYFIPMVCVFSTFH